jgi:hypothetical protein
MQKKKKKQENGTFSRQLGVRPNFLLREIITSYYEYYFNNYDYDLLWPMTISHNKLYFCLNFNVNVNSKGIHAIHI